MYIINNNSACHIRLYILFAKSVSKEHFIRVTPLFSMKLYLKVLLTSFAFFCRVAFSWHPPVFFSSDLGHVTPLMRVSRDRTIVL